MPQSSSNDENSNTNGNKSSWIEVTENNPINKSTTTKYTKQRERAGRL